MNPGCINLFDCEYITNRGDWLSSAVFADLWFHLNRRKYHCFPKLPLCTHGMRDRMHREKLCACTKSTDTWTILDRCDTNSFVELLGERKMHPGSNVYTFGRLTGIIEKQNNMHQLAAIMEVLVRKTEFFVLISPGRTEFCKLWKFIAKLIPVDRSYIKRIILIHFSCHFPFIFEDIPSSLWQLSKTGTSPCGNSHSYCMWSEQNADDSAGFVFAKNLPTFEKVSTVNFQ